MSPLPKSENRAIARAAGLVGSLTLLSRVAGLARDIVIGYFFGSGMAADAFFVAFRIPNLLRRFVAEGAMTGAFIPVFSEYLTQRSHRETLQAARAVCTIFTVFLFALTLLGVLFAGFWTRLFAPGFAAEPDKLELTIELTRLVFPYIFLISLVALLGGLLNALRHFSAPALAPLFFNLSLIGTTVLLASRVQPPIYAVAYGVLAGGVAQLAAQLPPLAARGFLPWPLWQPRHEAMRRILRLLGPMVFGAAVYQINVMIGTILASVLPGGTVSYLWYAGRVFEFPLGIFAVALGTAALPSFSMQAARRAYDEMAESVVFSLRLTSFVVVPAAVGIALLATPITSVLFQRGAFGSVDAALTGRALAAFAAGLWSVSLVRVLVPAFYAMHDVRTPVIGAGLAFVANLLLSLMLMGPVMSDGTSAVATAIAAATAALGIADLRHVGLALSTSLSATVDLLFLAALLRRRLTALRFGTVLASLGRTAVATAAMSIPVLAIAKAVRWESASFALRTGGLASAVAAGVVTYGLAAWALGSPEVDAARRIAANRLRPQG